MKTLIILVLIALAATASGQQNCKPLNDHCNHSIECCESYCRGDKCIAWGSIPDEAGKPNPCDTKECWGARCTIREKFCKKPPCPGVAVCLAPR